MQGYDDLLTRRQISTYYSAETLACNLRRSIIDQSKVSSRIRGKFSDRWKLDLSEAFGGVLMDVSLLSRQISLQTIGPRRISLAKALEARSCLRVIEAHSPMSALLAENHSVSTNGVSISFDALWSSSLTDSTLKGRPDIEILDVQSRISNIRDILEVTHLPVIVDGDTGREPQHFALNVRTLEHSGVAAVIIEDKTGLKKNSLLGLDVAQTQESIPRFCEKINAGKMAQKTDSFWIIARIESLILEVGLEDALARASAYCEAGADGIMIHCRRSDPTEVFVFAEKFRSKYPDKCLVCVPSSFSQVRFSELSKRGFNVVIYANHLLRASYLAMRDVALEILMHDRSLEAEAKCISIGDLLDLIPGTR